MTDFERNALTCTAVGVTVAAVCVSSLSTPTTVPLDAYVAGPMYSMISSTTNFAPNAVASTAKVTPVLAKIATGGKMVTASKIVTIGGATIVKGGLLAVAGGAILLTVGVAIVAAVAIDKGRKYLKK